MFFNDLAFVFVFLPAVLAAFFYIVPRQWRGELLLAASFIFYAFSGLSYVLLLAADILWVYLVTRSAAYPHSRWRLAAAISVPLIGLVYFKYLAFILTGIIGVPPSMLDGTVFAHIILPIGISFFTFELISYAIDRSRGEIKAPAPLRDFALFVTFFPHLVAGPILRFSNVASQFERLPEFRLTASESRAALLQISLGYAIKILIADWLAIYITTLKNHLGALSAADALFLVFGFSFQIYFDFFGYSLIAIGIGRLFGVRLPDNFRLPYLSLNPRDFWRRWHISLSFWLRDYLYFPLGGNRRYIRNILIVFVACGIWHGAGWNFALWGLAHALLVILYHLTARHWDAWPAAFQRALTFALVSFIWLPFLFNVPESVSVLKALGAWTRPIQVPDLAWLALFVAAVASVYADPDRIMSWMLRSRERPVMLGALAGIALVACLLFFDRTAAFIYFRF